LSGSRDGDFFIYGIIKYCQSPGKAGGFLRIIKKADGCHLYVMDKNIPSDYIYEGCKKYGCSWWWLRNQGKLKVKGNDQSRAVFIGTRASNRHYARVNQLGDGVRPALKLRLLKK
jgi:hypothetical protein